MSSTKEEKEMTDQKEKLKFVYNAERTTGGDQLEQITIEERDKVLKEDKKNKITNSYFEIDALDFKLRSKKYLSDKKKLPSKEAMFELISMFVIETKHKVWNVGENLSEVKEFLRSYPDDFFMIMVRVLPTKPKLVVIQIGRRKKFHPETDAERNDLNCFNQLFAKFINRPDKFKNERFKYLAKLESAPWLILSSVKLLGGEKPVLLGNGYLKLMHFNGDNYFEVDVDVSSHMIARKITNTVVKHSSAFRVSECYVLEGRKEAELPERVLMTCSMEGVSIKKVGHKLTEEEDKFFTENPEPKSEEKKK